MLKQQNEQLEYQLKLKIDDYNEALYDIKKSFIKKYGIHPLIN